MAALAMRQHGVVWAAQLRALGADRFAVRRQVGAGHLHPLYRGVYAVGHVALSLRGRYLAAVMACGPGAALSHRSGADHWELRPGSTGIEVTVPRWRPGPARLNVHSSRVLDAGDVVELEGIPVTSVARTLLDLAGLLGQRDLVRVIDRAERLELFDLAQVDDVLTRARGRRGAAALRRAVAEWRPRHTRSELEDRFQDLLSGLGLPQADFNALLRGERATHEVDALWRSHALVVQLDGFAFHRTRRDHERDAATDADLELAGYRVLRLTWDDVIVRRVRTVRRLRLLLPS